MREVTPEDGMVITSDTTLKPGVYHLPHGITVKGDHVTLNGEGVVIIGTDCQGVGVRVQQCSGVTIRGLAVERFYHGIYVSGSANVCVERCRVRHTHELPPPTAFLDVWLPLTQAYGGGILLGGVKDGFILNNDVQHQQNGIMLYGCENIQVIGNDASYNSGAGILLYESSHNTIERNVADFCCRIYAASRDAEQYHNGADAAALVIMCNSSHNVVRHNKLRSSGDGVFLGGFHRDQIKTPCNHNLFEHNDASFSPNIAFEATFSTGNIFRYNRADFCNYGFWLGWSRQNVVEDNHIAGNRTAGVAIEHGANNVIRRNRFERNGVGVQLWVNDRDQRGTALFAEFFPEQAESFDTEVSDNRFEHNDVAVHVWTQRGADYAGPRCRGMRILRNIIRDNRIGVQLERARDSLVQQNRIHANLVAGIRLVGCAQVSTDGNEL
ncbi:MAG: nitrous oxide reductase family maturation protein NosD [Thermoflexales bacterium]